MGCHSFGNKQIKGTICFPNIYEYKGYIFEWHPYLGPVSLKKDFQPRKKVGKGFYDAVTEFANLSKKEQKKYFIYG